MSIWSINILFISVTNPERDLQVLSSPDVHACVVRSNLLKVISVYREQSTCHGWSPAQKHTHTQNANQPLQLMDHLLNKQQSSLFFSWPSLSPLHSVSEEQTHHSREWDLIFCTFTLPSVIEPVFFECFALCKYCSLVHSFFPWALSSFLFVLNLAFVPLVFHRLSTGSCSHSSMLDLLLNQTKQNWKRTVWEKGKVLGKHLAAVILRNGWKCQQLHGRTVHTLPFCLAADLKNKPSKWCGKEKKKRQKDMSWDSLRLSTIL